MVKFGIIVASFMGASLLAATDSSVLFTPGAEAAQAMQKEESESLWKYSPAGTRLNLSLSDTGLEPGSTLSIRHSSFPGSTLSPSSSSEDNRLDVNYRSQLSTLGFLESRSTVEENGFGHYSKGYRQVLGYGLRVIDLQTVTFEIVPGVVGDYSTNPTVEERLNWMGNLNQNLSWIVTDGFVLNQNFNTSLERTEADDLSAVLNLDLETLFADRLSFKLSYEVHYDDSIGDALEQRDARLSTSVGFRF